MPLSVNLRHLEAHPLKLEGELPVSELDLDVRDELIRLGPALEHNLEVEKMDGGVLVRGRLGLTLECHCVRCLKPFEYRLELKDWARLLPLEGEDQAVVDNDCVDLTPYIREDILLELPQHPLCEPECRGLAKTKSSRAGTESGSSAWAELDKLKL